MAMQLFDVHQYRPSSERVWSELYCSLRPSIVSWVYSSGVSSWLGQEHDIADDILQEAIIRTLKYSRLVESGLAHPIVSITSFGRTVAQNHFRDLRRRELRLVRPTTSDEAELTLFDLVGADVDPAEVALDELSRFSLLLVLACIIATFPTRQRSALLTDLARLADLDDEQCPLRAAFFSVGIDLAAYHSPPSPDPLMRSRHAASLSMAYKRLRQIFHAEYRDLFS